MKEQDMNTYNVEGNKDFTMYLWTSAVLAAWNAWLKFLGKK